MAKLSGIKKMKNSVKIIFLLTLLLCLASCEEVTTSDESVTSLFISNETTEEVLLWDESSEDDLPNESCELSTGNEQSGYLESEESLIVEEQSVESSEESSEKAVAEGFVLLSEYIPDVILEVRYYSTYNFVGERIDGYEEPCILITKEAAEALKKVNDDLLKKGYRLKIFDAYRPTMAVDHFVRWSNDISDEKMKPYFYPYIEKDLLFKKGFIAKKSGHSRGSTVDLTLFCDETGKEVDMGGTFDFFGDVSHTYYTESLTEQQVSARTLLRETMIEYGFKPAKNEWWHFTLKNEPFPDTYFNFPVNSRVIKPNN